MPDDLPADPDLTDDQLAAEIVARVEAAAPNGSEEFRRQLVSLYTRQATGQAPPPGRISQQALADALGLSKTRIHQIETAALAKLWRELSTRFPDHI